MKLEQLLGDYRLFFHTIRRNVDELEISIDGYPLSHLGFRTTSDEDYQRTRGGIKRFCTSYVENEHNGRLISKLLLKEPLLLGEGFEVSLIELMPPKPDKEYPHGLEHLGVVLGSDFLTFIDKYKDVITGFQNQGKYCQPAFIRFSDGTRAKFYEQGLKEVVELEGHQFINV